MSGSPDERASGGSAAASASTTGPTEPVEVTVEERRPTKTWLRVTVHEGRNHLVRRLCEAIGHRAEKLQRVTLGPLELGKLPIGDFRPLTPREVTALHRVARAAKRARPSPSPRRARGRAPRHDRA